MISPGGINQPRRLLPDQVRDVILDRIHDGTLQVGDKLAPEPELGEEFGVSRATIREAVRSLVESGYLSRVQGSGTYVAFRARLKNTLERNLSYSKMISQAGFSPGRKVLSLQRGPMDEEGAKALGAGVGEEAVSIERVRSADRDPVIYSIDVIPSRYTQETPDKGFEGSLYELLESLGHTVAHGDATLVPVIADYRVAGILEVAPGSALLMIRQVDHTTAGTAVMFSKEWHVPGIFEISLLRRST